MPFNIKTKKILSEENCKRIIMLGISIRDKLENAEKGLISEYDSTKTYTNGMSVYYDDYLYECIYTTTGDFDSSKWSRKGDILELITKQDIEAMINLSDEELKTLQSLILDSSIELSHVWSSSKTYEEIQQCLSDSKTYTLKELSKKMGASYKVVADTTGVDSTEFLYLISNGTAYDIYALIDGIATKIGDTTIDLSQFYTKTEIDNDFLKKADADGKYTTQTSFNSHTSDTDIHTNATEKASYVKKTDITTTIDSSSTDSQVPSAKSVYDKVESIIIKQITTAFDSDTIENYLETLTPNIDVVFTSNGTTGELVNLTGEHLFLIEYREVKSFFIQRAYQAVDGKLIACRSKNWWNNTWSKWQKICTTSVADVGITDIVWEDEAFTTNYSATYHVKNGVCYVDFDVVKITLTDNKNGVLFAKNLPKAVKSKYINYSNWGLASPILFNIGENGNLQVWIGSDNDGKFLFGSFSYPVAES